VAAIEECGRRPQGRSGRLLLLFGIGGDRVLTIQKTVHFSARPAVIVLIEHTFGAKALVLYIVPVQTSDRSSKSR
jgi:hypothetical protein